MKIHCLNCGYEGKTKTHTSGSLVLEILLYFFFFIPGLIYSAWRLTSGRKKICPDCKQSNFLEQSIYEQRTLKKELKEMGVAV